MNFPKINYEFWDSEWNRSIGASRVYTNKNMINYIIFEDDINSCTNEILDIVAKNELDKENILRVVDLIYSWGGKSGRMFYVSSEKKQSPREELSNKGDVFNIYLEGIKLAQHGDTKSIGIFKSIRGIGSSYASKHAYFWSINSDNPLIIVDSKIAGTLGFSTISRLEKKHSYGEIVSFFKQMALQEFKESNPSRVERALFAFHNNYFLNDNSGWKKERVLSHDSILATELAQILFE